jgi:hypothetical protein
MNRVKANGQTTAARSGHVLFRRTFTQVFHAFSDSKQDEFANLNVKASFDKDINVKKPVV